MAVQLKICDHLAAFLEAYTARIANGITNAHLQQASWRIRTLYQNQSLTEELHIGALLADFGLTNLLRLHTVFHHHQKGRESCCYVRVWDIMREDFAFVREDSSLADAITALRAIRVKQPDMSFVLVFSKAKSFWASCPCGI